MEKIKGRFDTARQAVNALALTLNDEFAAQLKLLFEEKHLYQKTVAIDIEAITQEILVHTNALQREFTKPGISKLRTTNMIV